MAINPFMARYIHCLFANMVYTNELVLFQLLGLLGFYMVLWDRVMLFLKLKKKY